MTGITTHVLDTVLGKPAAGIAVKLEHLTSQDWTVIASSITDTDGRSRDLFSEIPEGLYRLTFATGPYFQARHRTSIYPEITITFHCHGDAHYHIPVLLSDNSYTTYRGS